MATQQKLGVILLLGLGSASASAAGWAVQVSATVQGVCEVQQVTQNQLTLRCTKNFVPAQPAPWLAGSAAVQTWRLEKSMPAPQGGTLNTYAADASLLGLNSNGLLTEFY